MDLCKFLIFYHIDLIIQIMSTTLYRKYRPSAFSEVIGQKHIVQTLTNAIKSGRVGQAYLFTGPRGTGKTSVARIFAKAINCPKRKNSEPCQKCEACKIINENRALDIIEIDAASHTGVDNIRELRETVKLPPTSLKYKVYIIDEAHMLSGGAFNALLKTLEEPPSHVIFILATTEVHKFPETILSRCQRFDFTRLAIPKIMQRLEQIAKLEKVKVENGALEIIAQASEGSMRDAESLLGQVIALEDKKITAEEVEFILGAVSNKEVAEFIDLVIQRKYPKVLEKTAKLSEAGVDFKNFGKSLLNYLRQMLVMKINPEFGKKLSYEMTQEQAQKIESQISNLEISHILNFINILQENSEKFKSSFMPQLYLEATIAALAAKSNPNPPLAVEPISNPAKKENVQKPKTSNTNPNNIKAQTFQQPSEITHQSAVPKTALGKTEDLDLIISGWLDIANSLKNFNHSLSSILKSSRPSLIQGNILIIKTRYDFYKDKINETQHRLTIEKAIDNITGINLKIKAVTEKEFERNYADVQSCKSLLQEAIEIIGGRVVKE